MMNLNELDESEKKASKDSADKYKDKKLNFSKLQLELDNKRKNESIDKLLYVGIRWAVLNLIIVIVILFYKDKETLKIMANWLFIFISSATIILVTVGISISNISVNKKTTNPINKNQ